MLAAAQANRIENLVRRVGALPPAPSQRPDRLIAIMGADKKTRGGKLRFVLPDRIGHVETVSGIPVDHVREVLSGLAARATVK